MLQHDQIFTVTLIGNYDAFFGPIGAHKELILCHLAEPYQSRCLCFVLSEGAVTLHNDDAVRRRVLDFD